MLLLWPGTDGAAAGNFGVPQLVGLATYVKRETGAEVDVVDLACERALGSRSLPAILAGPDGSGYDVIGLSCYSSYDWLKVQAIAELARSLHPEALICSGGYHASARPAEFVFDGSPFDAVVIGEGEKPLVRLVESVAGGAPIRGAILGPDPITDLDDLPPTDWSYLDRYRPFARKIAGQAEVYLSRGCPFDCAFCMEKAKREVSWRAYSVDRAMDELARLDHFLDLSDWTVYLADALFGMRSGWRKELLAKMAASPTRARKHWLLIRVDMVDDEDLRLFGEANCGLGFGLESGDPVMLATARKAGKLQSYLDRMRHVAEKTRELQVPWGANVIVGHPGETEDSLRTSAAFLRELFLAPRGTTGFLSVDPYRFYPGSPIDAERPFYEATHGTVFHRPRWWDDGDPEFLSEWIDPSRDLDYRRRIALEEELVTPILHELPKHFAYTGRAADYFRRAVDEQIAFHDARNRLHYADRYYAWQRYLGRRRSGERERTGDVELTRTCREARQVSQAIERAATADPAIELALREVPRERFVPLDAILASTRDEAIALDDSGLATVSAMHAYARAFALAGVREGSRVLDLGGGTGYGAALLARLVGPAGRVRSIEIDPALSDRARHELAAERHVEVVTGDATDPATWGGTAFDCVVVGFAIPDVPVSWELLPEGTVVVTPIEDAGAQALVRHVRRGGGWERERLEAVRYVPVRFAPPEPAPAPAPAPAAGERKSKRALPLARD